jgi:hypothetical protein
MTLSTHDRRQSSIGLKQPKPHTILSEITMTRSILASLAALLVATATFTAPASAGGWDHSRKASSINVGNGGTATGRHARADGGHSNYVAVDRRLGRGSTINVGNGGSASGRGAQARGGNDNMVEVNRGMGRGSTINVGNGGSASGRGANASGGSGNTVIVR